MAVPTSYLTSSKNLASILASIQKAGVPPKFTYEFLKQLGYPSSNDRPIIPILKSLGFLDQTGVPLDRYRRYRDSTQAGAVMAEGIREAYSDVFAIDQQAQQQDQEALKGIFSRLSGKSERVAEQMALTFASLVARADFEAPITPDQEDRSDDGEEAAVQEEDEAEGTQETPRGQGQDRHRPPAGPPLQLHHDIHIHLPETTEVGVYDAIFRALRQNFGTQ